MQVFFIEIFSVHNNAFLIKSPRYLKSEDDCI